MEGHISLEEIEHWLKWRTFPPTRVNAKNYWLHWICNLIFAGALYEKHMESWQMMKFDSF